jgi:hypothetical protein
MVKNGLVMELEALHAEHASGKLNAEKKWCFYLNVVDAEGGGLGGGDLEAHQASLLLQPFHI